MNAAKIIHAGAVKVTMEEPVVVDQAPSKPVEPSPYAITEQAAVWGRYRMPKIYRMPGGSILLNFSMSIDHFYDHGRTAPVFESKDGGLTWEKTKWPHPAITGQHPVISPIGGGDFYCIAQRAGIRVDGYEMPVQVGTYMDSMGFKIYRLSECPDGLINWFRDIDAVRWSPGAGWTVEKAEWDHEGQLIFTYNDKPQNIPGDWSQKVFTEHPVVCGDNELYIADYWTIYENGGKVPPNWECSLMASRDNARSWKRRSVVMSLPIATAEPVIEMNHAGELVCVVRTEQKEPVLPRSMYMAISKDKGYTWDEPRTVLGYGVLPRLLQLENGVMALSYGRAPGTWISFSVDGGHSWTEPYVVIDEEGKASSCGYTSMLAIGPEAFMIAYGDIHVKNADGEECKTILVRKVTVNPA